MATASSLRLAGGASRSAWLHNRFWSSGAGRIVATGVANALELSAHPPRTAVHCVFPNSACADNSHGPDAAGVDRGSNVAANEFWECDWFSVWLEHLWRRGWGCAGGRVSYPGVWDWKQRLGCRFGELHRRGNRLVRGKTRGRDQNACFAANISAPPGCEVSAAMASAFCQLWAGRYPSFA